MKRYAYTLITSAILSCFLIGCGGSSKSSSENANAGAPAQQTEPVAPAEPVTPSEQNNPVEPQTAEESSSPEIPSAQEEQEEPEEEEKTADSGEAAGGKLNLQVIDGYLAQIEACIVKDDDPAMPWMTISKVPILVNPHLSLTLPERQKSISHPSRLHS